ncbi:MAG TPA: 6-phosphofructokinase [Gemmatimonadaceae bacterium]|nr:6-phosphofructokinase [Gemmatimonadaceae bacterium]
MIKRVGILTGGGDVPGLNPCIKALVNRAEEEGLQAVGLRHGWGGFVNINLEQPETIAANAIELNRAMVRTIDRTGGTWLHTSRTNPLNMREDDLPAYLKAGARPGSTAGRLDVTPHVLRVIERLKLDVVIAIGGDDTLSYAVRLHDAGVPVLAIPKTMDNDVYGTDYCLGFSTAITRSVSFIRSLRTSAGSHERIAVIELFGRNCGETSLIAAYLSGADRALISEVPFDPERLAALVMADKRDNPSNYAMVTVSEGASMIEGEVIEVGEEDAFGHKKLGGVGAHTGDVLKRLTGQNIMYQQLGYLMRSGEPDSLDLMVALNYAHMAIDLLLEGLVNRMVVLRNGAYTNVPITRVQEGAKRVDVDALYDVQEYRPRVRHVGGKPMFLY